MIPRVTVRLAEAARRVAARAAVAAIVEGVRVKFATLAIVALASAPFAFSVPAVAGTERTFGGYECTIDCSGHKAGYEWAEAKGISYYSMAEDSRTGNWDVVQSDRESKRATTPAAKPKSDIEL